MTSFEKHEEKYGHVYKEVGPLMAPVLDVFYGNKNDDLAKRYKTLMRNPPEPEELRLNMLSLIEEAKRL